MTVRVLGRGWFEKMSLDGSRSSKNWIVRESVTRRP